MLSGFHNAVIWSMFTLELWLFSLFFRFFFEEVLRA
jgi:hypothetical protein